jgi:tetratricopeptide (TPR) repeat protein
MMTFAPRSMFWHCFRFQNDMLMADLRRFGTDRLTKAKRFLALIPFLVLIWAFGWLALAQDNNSKEAELISKENLVDAAHPKADWQPAFVGQKLTWHDRLRTGEDSRAALRMSDFSIQRLDELTELEVLPPPTTTDKATLDVKQGSAYFFSRETSREVKVRTPAANGGIRGTEFVVTVAADGTTSFIMIEGEVEASNDNGSVVVHSGERVDIKPGSKPAKTNESRPLDSAQWCFYYPGVLDPKEVIESLPDRHSLERSLSAYSSGDPLSALQHYPAGQAPNSPEEKLYRAQLLLTAGQVEKARGLLAELDQNLPNRQAIITLIAAITGKQKEETSPPKTASEWMAESYYLQAQDDLAGARQAAKYAIAVNPNFGFGWIRLGEVQLNRGQTSLAKEALEKGLTLAPNNPAAYALRGSIQSAEGKLAEAKSSFERAMALDSALGDAWAGRGLCLIRQGQIKAGRRDLFVAAALEPNRAIFRKYLADALANSDRTPRKARSSRPGVTDNSKPSSSGPSRPSRDPAISGNARPEPVYQGRIPGAGTNINQPSNPILIPIPEANLNPRPSDSGPTSHPEKGGDRTPTPGKGTRQPTPSRNWEGQPTQHPTPSRNPERGQPTSSPSPPERSFVPRLPPDQGQTIRKKKPTPSQSPTPN